VLEAVPGGKFAALFLFEPDAWWRPMIDADFPPTGGRKVGIDE
jgi:hypothetical protein